MLVAHSQHRRPGRWDTDLMTLVQSVSSERLRTYVDLLAFPRHYDAEYRANQHARNLLVEFLRGVGFTPQFQGSFDNIVATTGAADGPYVLLGAHYDSVPGTPGADDNGSALAVCLECARLIKEHGLGSAMIVFFNREEDGMLGSREFVADLPRHPEWKIREAHIFEMVGYCIRTAGSQRMPAGLPVLLTSDVGDFLGVLANRHSNSIADSLLTLAASFIPRTPVLALKMYLGIEQFFGHLLRSDHAPFWEAGMPALMWTDTADFRNPHYHLASDTPETLDYDFLSQVTQLALARVATTARQTRSS